MIGSLGDVAFEVSEEKIRTFRDFQMQRSAKYIEHAIHSRKGLLEFTGFSAVTASFNIRLDAGLGVNPKEELDTLIEIFTKHEAIPFILDGEPQGDNLWVIESIDEKFEIIDNHGTCIAVDVGLKLKEYLEIDDEEEN
ncbi:MAG: phage tail protein [Synergistaceae bacterium]|nr:phage tail protein [Synergistaceae bacterium]MBR0253198.1 phage tail protein [Synergistaceae bacterium]